LNSSELTYLLNKPNAINQKQTLDLEIILQDYPYLQCVRALYLKGLFNQDSFRYNYELKKTAAHTTDRTILFDFITSTSFSTIQENRIEEQNLEINNIVVSDSQIITIEETNSTLEITTLESKLEIGKPFTFEANEKHSFNEWLQLTKFSPIKREISESAEIDVEKIKKLELIDKFIETNPKIPAIKDSIIAPVVSEQKNENTNHLMTETLAKIYLEQKKYQRAIQAYEILILKYPEKSSFFADRIKNIKELQQNNN